MTWRGLIYSICSLAAMVAFLYLFTDAITNPVYQGGLTVRQEAVQQTKQVEAREWGATARVWGTYGLGGLAIVGVVGMLAWAAVRWQEERTERNETSEQETTERRLISAKKDVALAWIAMFATDDKGEPLGYPGELNGVAGVFVPQQREFVPLDVCRQEMEIKGLLSLNEEIV